MASTEGLPPLRIVLLDAHVRVAKTHNLDLVPDLHIHGGLLRPARSPERPVQTDLSALVVSHYFL